MWRCFGCLFVLYPLYLLRKVLLIQERMLGRCCWRRTRLAALWNTARFTVVALVLATFLGVTHALAAQRCVVAAGTGVFALYGVAGNGGVWPACCCTRSTAAALRCWWQPMPCWPIRLWPSRWPAALDSLPPHYLDAARSLGASPWRVFRRVTLPLLAPALRRGMAFAAATAVGEFAVTLFLSRPEWATLTTLIYQHLGRPGAANRDAALVLACVLMALALLAFALIETRSDEDLDHA